MAAYVVGDPQTYVVDTTKASSLSIGGGAHIEIFTEDVTVAAATSGDFIVFGELIGVALNDYDDVRGSIVVAVEGGYELEVTAEDAAGAPEDVFVGSWLYWDAAANEINRDSTNGVPIGQALEELAAGQVGTIGVVLRPQAP